MSRWIGSTRTAGSRRSTTNWEPGVPRLRARIRPGQHDDRVVEVGPAGPELRAGEAPDAVVVLLGTGRDRGQVRPGPLLAHPDREEALPRGDRRQVARTLGVGAVREDRGTGLPVGHPVRTDRGARREQFLDHDVALQRRAPAAAVGHRERHPDPAALGQTATEVAVPAGEPGVGPTEDGAAGALVVEERTDLDTQILGVLGQGDRGDEGPGGHRLILTSGGGAGHPGRHR